MIIIVCFGIYYMYKRYRLQRRSPHHTSHTNRTSFNTREFSPPYGQAPVASSAPPMAFYAMLPPSTPSNNNTSLVPATTQHNIVSWFYLSFLPNILSIYVYSPAQTRSYIITCFCFIMVVQHFIKPVNLLFNAVIVVCFIILNIILFYRTIFFLSSSSLFLCF
jgi:hypothetical protein